MSVPPQVAPESIAIQPARSAATPQVLILVADSIMDSVYRSQLNPKDCCLVWCQKKEKWRESVISFEYDVIILDFSFFPESPLEILHQVQLLSPDSSVIVLSDSEDVRVAIAAFRSGVADYLLKPVNPETLMWAVNKVVATKQLKGMSENLNADLSVFEAAHHISISETEEQMRALAMKHLVSITSARNGMWVWNPGQTDQRVLPFQADEASARAAFEAFRSAVPDLQDNLFHHRLTSSPEKWFHAPFAWIPLNSTWMGGILLWGISSDSNSEVHARCEFLVRNLELSLENRKRFVEAKQMTYVDDLTGLYNSRYLEVAASAATENLAGTNDGFCLLFIDIDHFKNVNDNNGHLAGSSILIQMSRLLKKLLRDTDLIFRYGGDEFIVMLTGSTLQSACQTAERLRAETEKRVFPYDGKDLKITLSIGVARFPDHGQDAKTVITLADQAMYQSKKTGRNSIFVATTGQTLKKASHK